MIYTNDLRVMNYTFKRIIALQLGWKTKLIYILLYKFLFRCHDFEESVFYLSRQIYNAQFLRSASSNWMPLPTFLVVLETNTLTESATNRKAEWILNIEDSFI